MTNVSDIPLSLMRMALGLLDREGGDALLVAARLQAAIDARTDAQPMQAGDKLDNENHDAH